MKRNGDVKISDFGLTGIYSSRLNPTQLREQQATSAGNYGMKNPMVWKTCQGTILYMSPERIQEQTHSFNSDIWSLGITLAELRMGKYPFKNHSSYFDILEEIKLIEKGQWQLPQDQFSPAFSDFLRQCIVVDPSKRPSAQQLLDHEWIGGIKSRFTDEVHMRQELSKWMQNAINGR
jgi:serine/threonine protein kinase